MQIITTHQTPFHFNSFDLFHSTTMQQSTRTKKGTRTPASSGSKTKKSDTPVKFTPPRKRTAGFFSQDTNHQRDEPILNGELLPTATFSLKDQIHFALIPVTLRQSLYIRLTSPQRQCESVLIQGLAYQGSPTDNVNTLEQIAERLFAGGITLNLAEMRRDGEAMTAVRNQKLENATTCGTMGSSNKGISLCINLASPGPSGESTLDGNRYVPTQFYDLPVSKQQRDGKRIYDITAQFTVTIQTCAARPDMMNSIIQSADSMDPNWRMLVIATWMFKDLNLAASTILMDMDTIFHDKLSDEEYAYFIHNVITAPAKPYFTNEDESTATLNGGGYALWLYTDLDNPIHMTVRNKLLTALLGSPTSPLGLGSINGIKMVYYQPTSRNNPMRLNISDLPSDILQPDIWIVRMANLPREITTSHMLILLIEGYRFDKTDILNIFLEQDCLNASGITAAAANHKCMILLLTSADVLRTVLGSRVMMIQDLQRAYQSDMTDEIDQEVSANPITITSPNLTSSTLQRLPEQGPMRRLSRLSLSAQAIEAKIGPEDAPADHHNFTAPWTNSTPPTGRQDSATDSPLMQDWNRAALSLSERLSSTGYSSTTLSTSSSSSSTPHLWASSSSVSSTPQLGTHSSPRNDSRRASPKRTRDMVNTGASPSGLTVSTPTSTPTGSPSRPPLPPGIPLYTPAPRVSDRSLTTMSTQDIMNLLHDRAHADPSGKEGVQILDRSSQLARTLRDGGRLPYHDSQRLIGQSDAHRDPSPVPPLYNLPLPRFTPLVHTSLTDIESDFYEVGNTSAVMTEDVNTFGGSVQQYQA